jgi:hypothetical protein
MEVVVEPDATPFVRIIAATLRSSAEHADAARKAERLRGVFALRSEKDPQALTMRFDRGRVEVTRGVASDAQVVATVDLDNMSGPDAAKSKVQGALLHPRFALGVSKLLEPKARAWQEHAHEFWAFAGARPGMPERLRVVCLDDGAFLDLGVDAEPASKYEVHGSEHALSSIFSGNSVLGQDLIEGKVYAVGSLQHVSVLTGAALDWMMRSAP